MTRLRFHFLSAALLLSLVALCLSALPSWGQAVASGTNGSVVGQVTDKTNAVVPGATVTLTDLATHQSQVQRTNDSGRYTFSNVPPGTYDLTVNKAGFAQTKV